ncbi:MAG: hypothetical protein NWF03_03640, partial [Candidatus Bathyarchaeota archaeon]|nr:hypothetical protein [Candidatus Bathyarchaeota archaeon]
VPPMANTDILVTYTSPDGVETNLDATTDKNGMATVSFTPDALGEWKVMAWYMGEDGAVASRTYAFSSEIIVNAVASTEPADALIATAGPETSTINAGESVTLTATTSGGVADFTYQWYQIISGTAVPLSGETAATLVVAPDAEGTYGYYCEVTDAVGQVDSSDTVQVKVGGSGDGSGLPMEYIYAIVGVIAVVVIAIVAYMVLKKRK